MHTRLSRRAIHVADVALTLWVAAWLLFAVLAYRDLRRLTELSDAAVAAGSALTTTADALKVVSRIPFVGDSIPDLERQVRQAARRTARAGRQSREDVGTYAVAVALGIGVGPTVPPLLFYVPLRRRWRRERRWIRAALDERRPDVRDYLAHQALTGADYPTFSRHSDRGELRPEDVDALAERELRRLGLWRRAGGKLAR